MSAEISSQQPEGVISRGLAKAAIGIGVYQGEILWQIAGAPGREDFEPLQHLGNVGVPFGGVFLGGIFINELGGSFAVKKMIDQAPAEDAPRTPEEHAEMHIEGLNWFHRRFFIPSTLATATIASVYSETLDSGTHDPVDAAYGIGATAVALLIYDRIRQRDFKAMRKAWLGNAPAVELNNIESRAGNTSPKSSKSSHPTESDYRDTGMNRAERRRLAREQRIRNKSK